MLKKIVGLILIVLIQFTDPHTLYASSKNITQGKNHLNSLILKQLPTFLPQSTDKHSYCSAISPINWDTLKNGKFKASFYCGGNKVNIVFSQKEMLLASENKVSNSTKEKINKSCLANPGGGGPPQ